MPSSTRSSPIRIWVPDADDQDGEGTRYAVSFSAPLTIAPAALVDLRTQMHVDGISLSDITKKIHHTFKHQSDVVIITISYTYNAYAVAALLNTHLAARAVEVELSLRRTLHYLTPCHFSFVTYVFGPKQHDSPLFSPASGAHVIHQRCIAL